MFRKITKIALRNALSMDATETIMYSLPVDFLKMGKWKLSNVDLVGNWKMMSDDEEK